MKIVDLAQAVENEYIGSPCGKLDQIMILFARDGMGTHYRPATRSIEYVRWARAQPISGSWSWIREPSGQALKSRHTRSGDRNARRWCQGTESGIQDPVLADIRKEALYRKIRTGLRPRRHTWWTG